MAVARSCKILYVDDDHGRARTVCQALAAKGFIAIITRRRLPVRKTPAGIWIVHWSADFSRAGATRIFRKLNIPVILLVNPDQLEATAGFAGLKNFQIVYADSKNRYLRNLPVFIEKSLNTHITDDPEPSAGKPEPATAPAGERLTEDIVHTYIRQMGALINNLPGAAYRCANDPDWTMEYISEGIEKITGYPAEEFILNFVRSYDSVIAEEDRRRVWEEIQKAVAKKIPFVLEYRIRTASGDIRWVWERGMALYGMNGRVQALEGFITDITERKYAEESWRESERRFREILETIDLFALMLDTEGTIIFCNENLLKSTGYNEEAVLGKNWFDIFIPAGDRLKRKYQDTIGDGQPFDAHYANEVMTRAGERRWVKWNNTWLRDLDGRIIGTASIGEDVTEKQAMELSLKEREFKLTSIFRAAPVGIGVVTERVIVEANERLCVMTGYAREELIGQSSRIFYPSQKEFDYVGSEKYRQIRQTGTGTVQTRWRRKDGTIIHVILSSSPIDPGNLKKGVTFTALDITERHRMELALRESEEKFRTLFDTMTQGVIYQDCNGAIISANPAAERILGIPLEDMLNRNSMNTRWQAIQEDGTDFLASDHPAVTALKTGKEVHNTVMGFIKLQTGRYHWININAVPQFRPGESAPFQVYSTFEDITERKQSEKTLLAYSNKLDAMLKAMPDLLFILNQDGVFEEYYTSNHHQLALPPEKIIGSNLRDVFDAGEAERHLRFLKESLRNNKLVTYEYAIPLAEGSKFYEARITPLDSGHVLSIIRDITESKRITEALRESEEKYRTLVELSPDAITLTDLNTNITFCNPQALEMLGLKSFEDARLMDSFSNIAPEDRQRAVENTKITFEKGSIHNVEYTFLRKDGSTFIGELCASAIKDATGNPKYFMGIVRDITRRKNLEKELEEQKEHYKMISEMTSDYVFKITGDENGNLSLNWVSQNLFDITGRRIDEVQTPEQWFSIFHPADRERAELLLQKVLTTGEAGEIECRTFLKNNIQRWIQIIIKPEKSKNNRSRITILGAIKDISDRKKMEESLRESEEKLRNIIENSSNLFYSHDTSHVFTYLSPQAREFFDCEPEEAMTRWTEFITDNPANNLGYELTNRAITTGIRQPVYELELKTKTGRKLWVEVHEAPVVKDGRTVAIVGVATDITERKTAEARLRESEDRLNTFIHRTLEGICILDMEGRIILWNTAAETITGLPPEEVIGKYWWEVAYTSLPETIRSKTTIARLQDTVINFMNLADQDRYRRNQYRILHKNGQEKIIDQNVFIIKTSYGIQIAFTFIDVTEQKLAETALRENEEKYRRLVELSPWPIAVHKDGKIQYINPAGVSLLGFTGPDELTGKNLMDFVPPEYRSVIRERIRLMAERKTEVPVIEEKFYRKDNSIIDVEVAAIPFTQGDETLFQVMIRDITQRKKTETALLESEHRYRRLIESVTDYIYTVHVVDGRAVQTYHGPGCEGVTGYTPEEYAADPGLWFRMIHDDDKPAVQRQIDNVISGSDFSPLEHRIVHKKGSLLWVRNTPVPKLDDQNRLIAYDGLIMDITDRRIAEDALRETEERLRTFIESVDDMVYYQGLDGRLSMMNSAIERITGYTLDDIKQDPYLWQKNTHPEDLKHFETFFHDHPEGLPYYEGEYRVRTTQGQWKWIFSRMFGVRNNEGRYKGYYCIDRDITDRKRYETQLVESEHRYRNLVETYPDAVIVEIGNRIVFTNSAGLKLLGYDSIRNMENADMNDIIEETITSTAHKGQDALSYPIIEGILTRPTGQRIEVEMVTSQTTFMNQPAMLRIIRDVSEINELRQQSRRMEQLAALGQMAATIAHEIRNPLGAVSLNFQFLFHELSEMQKYQKVFRNIEEGIARIQNIIAGILDYSRPVKPHRIMEHLHTVIDRSILSVAHEFELHQMSIEKNFTAASDIFSMDVHQMMRVFINLLTNARQAMTGGGKVTIQTVSDEQQITVTVKDTGKGIAAQDMEKVFSPFFTTKTDGSGLGLAIVFRILEQHGAKISVESDITTGTVFTLEFRKTDLQHANINGR